jgi:hypothetical protein
MKKVVIPIKIHLRILIYATLVWLLFFILGMPDYYLQYSTASIIVFEILLLIPFSIIIWLIFKPVKASRRMRLALWYSFYFTVPLFLYDLIYCGFYLGYGIRFVPVFWFLSVYYVIPWILFPLIAFLLNKKSVKNKYKNL